MTRLSAGDVELSWRRLGGIELSCLTEAIVGAVTS